MAAISEIRSAQPRLRPGMFGRLAGARSVMESHQAKSGYIFLLPWLPWLIGLTIF